MISAAHTAAAAETMPAGEPDGGSCATSLHLGSVTRAQIEDFLYREARLLDDWDLDTWLTLWAEEGTRYVVPTTTSCACGCGWNGSTAERPTGSIRTPGRTTRSATW